MSASITRSGRRAGPPGSIVLLLVAAILPAGGGTAQEGLLRSGPMVGYSEMREVLLWAQTTRPADVRFRYWEVTRPDRVYTTRARRTDPATAHVARLLADSVLPGRRYAYALEIDGREVARPYPLEFQSRTLWQWRSDPPPLRFAVASCFYVNEETYDRPGEPYGGDYRILERLFEEDPDFMVWMGDNVYLREGDWYTRTGILHRYTHTRALPELQPLLGSVHHYAIWDDHDYGPNDADRSFVLKDVTEEVFELFWGGTSSGLPGRSGSPGIVSTFEWSDVQFFLLDNRWWRAANGRVTGERDYLGEEQIEWLVDALAGSGAPFKFVVVGGQVLNPYARFENYSTYPAEREHLLTRLRQEGVPGVMFLTGDRHFTELTRLERPGTYPLYDLTVSPLTAGVYADAGEEPNPLRVEGTFVGARAYGILEVTGPRRDRVLTIRVVDADGAERWTRQIRASELR